jgi:hypothetical protein
MPGFRVGGCGGDGEEPPHLVPRRAFFLIKHSYKHINPYSWCNNINKKCTISVSDTNKKGALWQCLLCGNNKKHEVLAVPLIKNDEI